MLDTHKIRDASIAKVALMGIRVHANLPFLDIAVRPRTNCEVSNRILALYGCVAVAYGFPADRALEWLATEDVADHLSADESRYLRSPSPRDRGRFRYSVEALWALTWAGRYHDDFDFRSPCSNDFVSMFPDLKTNTDSGSFLRRCSLRSLEEIAAVADMAYCIHWALREYQIKGQGGSSFSNIEQHVVTERRRALDWLISADEWDSISPDT